MMGKSFSFPLRGEILTLAVCVGLVRDPAGPSFENPRSWWPTAWAWC